MDKIVTIAVREFLETVRTKTFLITVVLMPLLIMGFVFGAERVGRLTQQEKMPPRRLALLDETGLLAGELERQIAAYNQENPARVFVLEPQPPGTDPQALTEQVRGGTLYGYLHIPAGVLEVPHTSAQPPAVGRLARRDQQLQAGVMLERMVNEAVQRTRLRRADPPMDPDVVERLRQKVPLAAIDVRTGQVGRDDTFVHIMTPFAFMFLLFMGTMQISWGLLSSVIEEKSSRVVEVLLSAVSPLQLMAGKISGMILVGLLLVTVWGTVGYVAAEMRGFGHQVSADMLLYAALYFVPGFLLLAAILGALGSACNTLKEAQSLASPITILTIIPMVLWFQISQNPGSIFNVVLSYVPPITPFIMILRITADPHTPLWQVISTLAVLWAGVFATIWAAGKIFRVGVLMYGKPPTPRELLHWLRRA